MTFTITDEDTGRSFYFAGEDAYEAALDWYNSTEKGRIVEFCAARGLDLTEETSDPYYRSGTKLIADWAAAAMEAWAAAR